MKLKNIINWENYKNLNFILILIMQVTITVTILSFLMPVLDFIAINLKKDSTSTFYDYAVIANVVLMLPNILSIVTGIIITRYRFQKLSIIIGIAGIIVSLLGYLFEVTLFMYIACYVFFVAILLGASGISIYRLMMARLKYQLDDIQSDIFIFTGLGSAIGYKLAGYLYELFGVKYIFWVSVLAFLLLLLIGYIIDSDEYINNHSDTASIEQEPKPKVFQNLGVVFKDKGLLLSIAFFALFCFLNSPFDILVATINYHAKFGTNIYASFLSIASIAGFGGALLIKLPFIQQLDKKTLFTLFAIVFGIIYISFAFFSKHYVFYLGMFFVGFSRTVLQITMNLIICYRVASSATLTKIATLVNGLVISIVMIASLLSSWITNIFLKNDGSYINMLILFGSLIILSGLLLSKIKTLSVSKK